jgi:hypothetical protein
MPSRRHSSEMFSSPRNPSSADLFFSRMMRPRLASDVFQYLLCRRFALHGFLFHLRYDELESSIREVPQSVSQLLTADTVSCSVWLLRLTQLLWRRGTAVTLAL